MIYLSADYNSFIAYLLAFPLLISQILLRKWPWHMDLLVVSLYQVPAI